MNIYVSNLSFNVQDEDLKGFFAEYGEVSSARIIMDKFTQKSRGFGFVEMPNDAEAEKAIAELNGGVVEGRTINVTVARPKEEGSNSRPSGGNRGGGGGGRSFSNNGGGGNRW
jgi:RNA recognition motif-containing protein